MGQGTVKSSKHEPSHLTASPLFLEVAAGKADVPVLPAVWLSFEPVFLNDS